MKPVLLVVAGPNGAGKTTVTARLRAGIAFETVLSTDEKVDFLARAKDAGYFIRVFFIATSDPRINAARVADRVLAGGHSVPIEKILSRHVRAIGNLAPAIALADRVYIYDNSVESVEARLCARTQDGLLRKIYGALPQWIADALAPLDRHADFVDLALPSPG